jgi:hypothetical protein
MHASGRLLCILALIAISCASCATPPKQNPAPPPVPEVAPAPQPEPTVEPAVEPPPAETFVATEELYKKTFDEVQAVIDALTTYIAQADYESWLGYLTEEYVASRSSAEFLGDASKSAVLKKSSIVLKSLKDYFTQVVVQSHLQASLSEIQFMDATHVKAMTRIQDTPVILYYLVRENGGWKVGLKQSGEQ